MKKKSLLLILLLAALLILLAGFCIAFFSRKGPEKAPSESAETPASSPRETENTPRFVRATVTLLGDGYVLVSCDRDTEDLKAGQSLRVETKKLKPLSLRPGMELQITYVGSPEGEDPTTLPAAGWDIVESHRNTDYSVNWLEKETAVETPNSTMTDFVITKIYKNCFFAVPVIPMPYEVRFIGNLPEQWCVGDQVSVTYQNAFLSEDGCRMEAEAVKVTESTFVIDPNMCYKPVIYLYPEKKTRVSVKLDLKGKLTCTYPAYKDGWEVIASPDGTLGDGEGKTYNYLYWEGIQHTEYDFSKGFCVKGEDTAPFLESALPKLGLSPREANEFIVYWLPLMEPNPYNLIAFQTDAYTDGAKLSVSPAPDTVIRVFMAWKRADTYTSIPPQELFAPERKGFTLVEWGGTEIGD